MKWKFINHFDCEPYQTCLTNLTGVFNLFLGIGLKSIWSILYYEWKLYKNKWKKHTKKSKENFVHNSIFLSAFHLFFCNFQMFFFYAFSVFLCVINVFVCVFKRGPFIACSLQLLLQSKEYCKIWRAKIRIHFN